MKSFSDNLTPGQIQQILDELQIPWRDYKPNADGWIDLSIDDHVYIDFHSTCGINIYHGGFKYHYMGNKSEGSADIVKFVAMIQNGISDTTAINKQDVLNAMNWILDLLGIQKGVKPPDVPDNFQFANQYFEPKDKNFVRLPIEILKSRLGGNDKIVWSAIYNRVGNDKIYSFAGTRKLCEDTGLTRPSVSRAILNLKRYGLIIEKSRGHGKPPARFPLVADTSTINSKIDAHVKSGGKEVLPGVVKNRSRGGKEPLPKLDPCNYTHKQYPEAKVENEKTPFYDAISFSMFYLTSKKNIDHYSKFEALPEAVKANWNHEWRYDSEFSQWLNSGSTRWCNN